MTEGQQLQLITKVLRHDWDPIGCGEPEDEYASYAPRVVLLINEAMQKHWNSPRVGRERAIAEVTAFLCHTRLITIGLDHESRTRDADGAIACVNALYPRE